MEETKTSGGRTASASAAAAAATATTTTRFTTVDNNGGNSTTPVSATSKHSPGAIRFAEKRRIGTCPFADRIATISLECYRSHIPKAFQQSQPQTCIATIVAHFAQDDTLQVQSLGVGTKFLSYSTISLQEEELQQESELQGMDGFMYGPGYGRRVRDCHAEVLARRAFRRQLYAEIMHERQQSQSHPSIERSRYSSHQTKSILERCHTINNKHNDNDNNYENIINNQHDRYRLRSGVTLHMYCSSAPCGNATLKKFATMQKEVYNPTQKLWFCNSSDTSHGLEHKFGTAQQEQQPQEECHERIPPHSLKLGQFALLLKKDHTATNQTSRTSKSMVNNKGTHASNLRHKHWPANQSDDWCPPGTTIVWSSHQGSSIHTCSDKICRWNVLGLQGSLLSSLLGITMPSSLPSSPLLPKRAAPALYMSSFTVGRKFTSCVCRRAICCRATTEPRKRSKQKQQQLQQGNTTLLQNDATINGSLDTVQEPSKSSLSMSATIMPQESSSSPHPWSPFSLVHPAVLGTGVYMDDDGVLAMNESSQVGQDVRMHSPFCYAWWPGCNDGGDDDGDNNCNDNDDEANHDGNSSHGTTECIDGTTGYAIVIDENPDSSETPSSNIIAVSQVSTAALLRLHRVVTMHQQYDGKNSERDPTKGIQLNPGVGHRDFSLTTLESIRSFKEQTAPVYEMAKTQLLSKHPMFRGWKRRCVNETASSVAIEKLPKQQNLQSHKQNQQQQQQKSGDSGIRRNDHDHHYQKSSIVKVSKTLSWALRHAAPQLGLDMGPDGYVPLEQLLHHTHPKLKGIMMTRELVYHVVQSNEKQRFSIMERDGDGGSQWFIRANQGHSIPNVLDPYQLLTPIDPSTVGTIVHGTYMEAWTNHIRLMGLSKMKRTHIHFAKGLPTEQGVISGMRSSCEVLIYINGVKCRQDGIAFFESANGVILTEGKRNGSLPIEYFSHVVTTSGQVLLDQRESSGNS